MDGENEAEDPVSQSQAQLAALRWVQLVGVRGSSIHTGQIWVELRTTVEGEGGVRSVMSQEVAIWVNLSLVHNTFGFAMSVPPHEHRYIFLNVPLCRT